MTTVFANRAFDQNLVNFERMTHRDVTAALANYVNQIVEGQRFQDVYRYQFAEGPRYSLYTFGGNGLAAFGKELTSGSVEGLFKHSSTKAAGGFSLDWSIKLMDPLLPSAMVPWAEMSTARISDDLLWFQNSLFHRADYFELSRFADRADAGAGNDSMVGGGGNDTLLGGAGNDFMRGDAGSDYLDGGQGDDTLMGGLGNDRFGVDSRLDQVFEDAAAGVDTIVSSVSFSIRDVANVEHLELTRGASDGTGNELNNRITGNRFNNVLDGFLGADTLVGGDGDDTYVVDDEGDTIVETNRHLDPGGIDTVRSSITFSIAKYVHVENLTLIGPNAANATGNAKHNRIIGNDADNWISGGGGDDTMRGNGGDDVYIVDSFGDYVSEQATFGHSGGGMDTVRADFSYNLESASGVENLVLRGIAATHGTGNHLDNDIQGNAAANVLDGGRGADALHGFNGDDTYFVDNAGDVIHESADPLKGGFDVVYASVSFSLHLGATQYIEKVVLTGNADIDATGNQTTADHLVGNGGNNILHGGFHGGDLIDTLEGRAGDDVYVVTENDIVSEAIALGSDVDAGGYDIVEAIGTFTLPAFIERGILLDRGTLTGNDIGNLLSVQAFDLSGDAGYGDLNGMGGNDTLRGADGSNDLDGGAGNDSLEGGGAFDVLKGGTGADSLAGGDGDDHLHGEAGDDVLGGDSGHDRLSGGTGADVLAGGAGRDAFHFAEYTDSLAGAGDVINDFTRGEDRIWLGFVGVPSGDDPVPDTLTEFAHIAFSGHVLSVDVNNDQVADFQVELVGVSTLTWADFGF